jgi:hypothetical protein
MRIKDVISVRFGKYCFWIALLALTANLVRVSLRQGRVRAANIRPVPYTAMLKESVIDTTGKTTDVFNFVFALRSDGSRVIKSSGPVGRDNEDTFRVVELSSGTRVEIKDLRELKSSTSTQAAPFLRDPAARCLIPSSIPSPSRGPVQESVVGEESISGYRAAKIVSGKNTSWYALDNGCALLRSRMAFEDGSASDKSLVALMAGEPERALFYVPTSYKEVPPSQLAVRPSTSPAGRQVTQLQKLDAYYFSHRP